MYETVTVLLIVHKTLFLALYLSEYTHVRTRIVTFCFPKLDASTLEKESLPPAIDHSVEMAWVAGLGKTRSVSEPGVRLAGVALKCSAHMSGKPSKSPSFVCTTSPLSRTSRRGEEILF